MKPETAMALLPILDAIIELSEAQKAADAALKKIVPAMPILREALHAEVSEKLAGLPKVGEVWISKPPGQRHSVEVLAVWVEQGTGRAEVHFKREGAVIPLITSEFKLLYDRAVKAD